MRRFLTKGKGWKTGLVALAAGLAALGLIALSREESAATGASDVEFPRAQVVVETAGGTLGLDVEVARTPAQRARGLMFRTTMDADAGMLFIYDSPREVGMWMKNTILPLDMVFIAADGRIAHVVAHTTPMSEATIASRGPVRAVLELLAGAAKRLGIRRGDRVDLAPFVTP